MGTNGKIFVSGASGFIGTRLIQALIDRGHEIRALVRRPNPPPPPGYDRSNAAPLQHEQVELVHGDITDRDSLRRAIEGCSRVFHLAAYAKNWARHNKAFFDMNVQGTRNVLDAARELAVKKIVLTSTIMTLGATPKGVIGDEEMPRPYDYFLTDYEETKAQAEKEALTAGQDGLPVVVVNPTRVFGPGHLTEGNALSLLIDDYDRGMLPVLLNCGVNVGNYVLVDDVVQGHLLAMEKGRAGQRYIIGGENVSLKELFNIVDQVSGKRHFQIHLWWLSPLAFAYMLKKRADWFNVHPQITPGWIRTFIRDAAFSCEKAKRELGYRPTPLVDGIRLTYEWLLRLRKEGLR
jgi:nucleoside-diphosphate-sugar epimerase